MNQTIKGTREYRGTMAHRFETAIKAVPNTECLIYGDTRLTFKEIDKRTNAMANALLDLGLKKGDHAMLMDYNSNPCFEAFTACTKIGIAWGNLNYRFVPKEIAYVCNNNETKVVFINEIDVEKMKESLPECETVEYVIVNGKNVPSDMFSFEDLIKKYPKTKPKIDEPPFLYDTLGFLYTGGTTGMPKGVELVNSTFFSVFYPSVLGVLSNILKRVADAPREVWDTIGNIVGNALPIPGISPLISSILDSRVIKEVLKSPALPNIINKVSPIVFSPSAATALHTLVPLLVGRNLRWLLVNPIVHAWGFMFSFTPFMLGSTNVFLVSKSLDVKEICETIEQEKINILTITGDGIGRPLLRFLDENKGKYDLRSLFVLISGGMHLSPDIRMGLVRHMPQLICTDILASSEALGVAANVTLSSDEKIAEPGLLMPDTLRPMKIIDPESGKELKTGEIGEIVIYGGGKTIDECLTQGYYRDEERTKKTWKEVDGEMYIRMGDMGWKDEKGYVHLVGRGSECINTGGEKVFPDEVENMIRENQKVEDVAVTGVPDERWGEAVTAVVQLKKGEKATEEEIKESCKGKIAGYKIPKHVIFADEIPKTSIYKTSYKEVRELAKRKVLGSK